MARKSLPTEPFELVVGELDAHGRATGTMGDRRLAVHGALPGERVVARYLLGRRFKGQAETLEAIDAATGRVKPACPQFGVCGACALQHLDTSGQLDFKQSRLDALLDGVDVAPDLWLPPLDGGRWQYRRKARLSVRHVRKKERVLLGFRERDGRFVTDMAECPILAEPVGERLTELGDLLQTLDARDRIPQLEVACGDHDAVIILRHLDELSDADRARLMEFQSITGLGIWLQGGGPATAGPLDDATPKSLAYRLDNEDLVFQFHPLDFFQVNAPLNALMVDQAMEQLALDAGHRALDLFSGLGNFTLPMAKRAAEVVGVEGSDDMTRRAADNAARNGIGNARFETADLYADTVGDNWPDGPFDRVLLDPPRSGAEALLDRVAATGAERIVYVSCNPETLARDAGRLVHGLGYKLAAAGIMDMFPHTTHVESMAVFEQR